MQMTEHHSLRTWWRQFTAKNVKKDPDGKGKGPATVFGSDLREAIKYASVPICVAGPDGRKYVYGYIPTIVAKCGMFLKEKATTTEGIFRLSGSVKRIQELQEIFDEPPSYGKTLTWTGYSVHDAATVLRRYLNRLPDPVIRHEWYDQFRNALETNKETHTRVLALQKLIGKLPKENQHLLLYILDLLAVFSSNHQKNRMTSKNLASIFQPGVLSHPSHDMVPEQYQRSQAVVEFLVDYQNYFLMTVPPPQLPQLRPSGLPEASTSKSHPPTTAPPPLPAANSPMRGSQAIMEPPDLNEPRPRRQSTRRTSLTLDDRPSLTDDSILSAMPDNPSQSNEQDPALLGAGSRTSTLTRSRTLPGSTRRRTRDSEGPSSPTVKYDTADVPSPKKASGKQRTLAREPSNLTLRTTNTTKSFGKHERKPAKLRKKPRTRDQEDPKTASLSPRSRTMPNGPEPKSSKWKHFRYPTTVTSTPSETDEKLSDFVIVEEDESLRRYRPSLSDDGMDEKENNNDSRRRRRHTTAPTSTGRSPTPRRSKTTSDMTSEKNKDKRTFLRELGRKMWFGNDRTSENKQAPVDRAKKVRRW